MLTGQRGPRTGGGRLGHDVETLVLAVGVLAVILAICVATTIWPGLL